MMFLAKMNRNGATRWFALGLAGLLLAGLLVLVSCDGGGGGGGDGSAEGAAGAGAGTRVARDGNGVWFITDDPNYVPNSRATRSKADSVQAVASLYNVFKSMGYLVAEDRLWQMETYRRTARGNMSAIFGSDFIISDTTMRTIGYTDDEYMAGFDDLEQETQDVIIGYVAGINERIQDVLANDSALLPHEFKTMGITPDPWTVIDVMAWVVTLQRNFDPEGIGCLSNPVQVNNLKLFTYLQKSTPGGNYWGRFNDLRGQNDPDALTYIPGPGVPITEVKSESLSDYEPALDYETIRELAEQVMEKGKALEKNLEKINAVVKMGSYAWVVAGSKTHSGHPIIYSGPQMGFEVPSIVCEGSIRAGGLNVSGMTVSGIPGIIIGRTPHHAWSMQVGHAHTVDFYLDELSDVTHTRSETFQVAGQADENITILRTVHGPVVGQVGTNLLAWKYSHWNYELKGIKAFLDIARAESMDEFGAAIDEVAVSQHYCYADRDGNIAYWMSGRDPVRPDGEWRFPQSGTSKLEWDAANLIPRSTDRNTTQGFYGG